MSIHANYYLKPTFGKSKKPYPSGWKMTKEEAAKLGLTDADIVPGSEEDRRDVGIQSAGIDGAKATRNDEGMK